MEKERRYHFCHEREQKICFEVCAKKQCSDFLPDAVDGYTCHRQRIEEERLRTMIEKAFQKKGGKT